VGSINVIDFSSTNVYVSGAIGYRGPTNTGGNINQTTNRSTAVTLNKPCGTITLVSEAIPAGQQNSFTFTNSFIGANDFLLVQHGSVGQGGVFAFTVNTTTAGQATITVRNVSSLQVTSAPVLQFVVIKSTNS
jgi:hypothetical protein